VRKLQAPDGQRSLHGQTLKKIADSMLSMWMSAALDFAASALTFVSTDPAFLQIAQVFRQSSTMREECMLRNVTIMVTCVSSICRTSRRWRFS
jgi:hypothetical protein